MKQITQCLVLLGMLMTLGAAAEEKAGAPAAIPAQFNNPVFDQYLADPYCWYHDGWYYAIGTGKNDVKRSKRGEQVIPMAKSRDLQHWEFVGWVLIPADDERGGNFWAPEVAYNDGTFYLYYHASGNGKGFRIRVATSKNPEGPYRDTGTPLTDVTKTPFAIDSHQFRDSDGQWYCFYATDFKDFDGKTFRGTALAVDRMNSMTELEGNPKPVMRAHWQWQVYQRNREMYGKKADWYTLEGPTVRKHEGKYYCFYSGGNYTNDSYGVDYLVADSVMGPWREVGRERGPQIMRSIPGEMIGPGHNSIVSSPDGKRDFIVYHAWNQAHTDRLMCVDPIVWTPEGPKVERFQKRIQECNAKAAQGK